MSGIGYEKQDNGRVRVKLIGNPELPVDNDVSWPKVGQEVQDIYDDKIGSVIDILGHYTEENRVVMVDWGLHIGQMKSWDLKEVDS